MIRPIDRVNGLTISVPGAGIMTYRLSGDRRDSLDMTDKQRFILRRAKGLARQLHDAAVSAGEDAEEWPPAGYEPELQHIAGPVLWVRDCRRPDGSDSSVGMTAIRRNSADYWDAYRDRYQTELSRLSVDEQQLVEWWSDGIGQLISDMEYRGHTIL